MRVRYSQSLGRHSKADWESLKAEIGRCVRCGRTDLLLEKDHIQPIYAGGSDGIENLQPLCGVCNRAKGPEAINRRRFREVLGWDLLFEFGGNKMRERSNQRMTLAPSPQPGVRGSE